MKNLSLFRREINEFRLNVISKFITFFEVKKKMLVLFVSSSRASQPVCEKVCFRSKVIHALL